MKKRIHPINSNENGQAAVTWFNVLVMVVCVGLLATGFFFAARQHFTAMDLGIKNSKLRKQVDDMESEKRRLLLSREIVRSPGEVKRIAIRHGLRDADEIFTPEQANAIDNGARSLVVKTSLAAPAKNNLNQEKAVKAFYPVSGKAKTSPAGMSHLDETDKQKKVSSDLMATTKIR